MGAAVVVSRPEGGTVLEVTSGAHSGTTLRLTGPVCRVGAAARSDIVLSDPGVADDHVALRIERGRAIVEARGGDVGLGGGQIVPRGNGCRVKLPAEIRVGTSVLRLSDASPRSAMMSPQIAAVACVALLLVGSIVATQAGVTGDAEPEITAATPNAAASPASPADPVAELQRKIAAAGLSGLKVEPQGDRIVVKGVVEDPARPRWAATQRWFDEEYGGRYVLASEVGAKSALARPRFQLQAIWFGPSPYVVTADGQRRYAGATLGDGWVLKDIRENRIIVAKADEEMALSY